jgi:hypothetical protein
MIFNRYIHNAWNSVIKSYTQNPKCLPRAIYTQWHAILCNITCIKFHDQFSDYIFFSFTYQHEPTQWIWLKSMNIFQLNKTRLLVGANYFASYMYYINLMSDINFQNSKFVVSKTKLIDCCYVMPIHFA